MWSIEKEAYESVLIMCLIYSVLLWTTGPHGPHKE